MSSQNNAKSAAILSLVLTGTALAAEWTPVRSDKVIAWFDAQDASTIHMDNAPGRLSQWDDKSTNSNHAVQADTGNQLYYTNSEPRLSGFPAVYNDSLASKNVETPQMAIAELYAVCAYGNTTTNNFDGHRSLCGDDSNLMKIQGNRNSANWNGLGSTTFYEVDPFKNGETNSTTIALPMPITMWRFSRSSTTSAVWRIMGRGGGQFWEGPAGELIFTDGTEDLEEQQKFEGYLAWKWGIQGDLPSYHPWKNEPPIYGLKGTVMIIR